MLSEGLILSLFVSMAIMNGNDLPFPVSTLTHCILHHTEREKEWNKETEKRRKLNFWSFLISSSLSEQNYLCLLFNKVLNDFSSRVAQHYITKGTIVCSQQHHQSQTQTHSHHVLGTKWVIQTSAAIVNVVMIFPLRAQRCLAPDWPICSS